EGSMCASSLCDGSTAVTADIGPPDSRTCNTPPDVLQTMMSPVLFHDPPTATPGSSPSVCGTPPAISRFFSLLSTWNATNLPSGDQNGGGVTGAVSEPGKGCTPRESIALIQRRGIPSGPCPTNTRRRPSGERPKLPGPANSIVGAI